MYYYYENSNVNNTTVSILKDIRQDTKNKSIHFSHFCIVLYPKIAIIKITRVLILFLHEFQLQTHKFYQLLKIHRVNQQNQPKYIPVIGSLIINPAPIRENPKKPLPLPVNLTGARRKKKKSQTAQLTPKRRRPRGRSCPSAGRSSGPRRHRASS